MNFNVCTRTIVFTISCSLALLLIPSCASPKQVGQPFGQPFAEMIDRATERVLRREISTRGDSAPPYEIQVAILPPEFSGSVSGGSNESFVHARIATAVNNSQLFTPVSRHLVQNAINASGVSNAKALLGLAAARERFMTVLADNGFIPEFIIYPEITTMEETTKGVVIWRETSLNLQLAKSSNGMVAHEQFDSVVQSTKSSSSEN